MVKILMGGAVDNGSAGKDAGKDAGDAAGNAAKSGKDANNADNKSAKKDGKAGKDRSAGGVEKLSLDAVKALPACVASVMATNADGTISTLSIEPPSGENKCAVSADQRSDEFGKIINEIKKLAPTDSSFGFYGGKVYAYGRLSKLDGKNYVGLFSGKNISNIDNIEKFDISYVTDMSYLFKDSSLTDFSFLSSWDVSNVTNMQSMFEGCTNLDDISGLSSWDVSNVTNMNSMFSAVINDETKRESFDPAGYAGTMAIKSLEPLSNWNVSNVTKMDSMFEGCTEIKEFTGLASWNTKSLESMNSMFRYCLNIGGGDQSSKAFEKWDVSKVTGMRAMFAATHIPNTDGLKNWNVSNVTAMDDMFAKCTGLDSIKGLANWNKPNSSTNRLTSTFRMFYECNNISSIEPLKDWNVGNVTNMHDMFDGCSGLKSLSYIAGWNVDNVTDMHGMFNGCSGLTNLSGLENWNVNNVKNMSGMFSSCANNGADPEKGFNISALSNWAAKVGNVTNMYGMFSDCEFLKSLSDLAKWNVGNVADMHDMFNGCKSLSSLSDLKDWKVNKVENMSGMFANCKKLTSAEKLSEWATKVGNVTNMSSLFSGCELLANISDLSGWTVNKVTDMNSLFSGCKRLSSLSDLAKWNVGNVADMHDMFEGCIGLSNLSGLAGWKVDKVTNMCEMFSHSLAEGTDDKLTDISALSKWNVGNVTNMSSMFSDCKSLTGDADLSKWDISKVTNLSSMFSGVGAKSGDKLVLDFSNKTFTKSTDPNSHFSVDSMFSGFKGTLIANNLQSSGFENNPEDDPIKSHFADGEIFSLDENGHSNNIVVTNNITILDTISNDDDLKKIAYYIPVKAKLMEPGDIKNDNMTCDCNRDSGGTTYTYYVPALYNSSNLEKKQDEKSQDYAYRIVKNSFASKLRYAIDSQSGKGTSTEEPGGDEPGGDEPGGDEGGDESGGDTDTGSRSATLKSRVKKLRSARKSRSVRDGDDEDENSEPEPDEKQGNTYKIMFKKPSEGGCTWTELGEGEGGAVPVSNPKSPLVFFTTTYYLETFVQPVPLPHTGGQSAIMFTFLSIGLFSMFAVAGAFGRHGWVASVLSGTALTGFAKAFGGGALDIAAGFKHCFAHSVVSGSMLKTAVSAATGFFARFRSDDSTFGKHTKQR